MKKSLLSLIMFVSLGAGWPSNSIYVLDRSWVSDSEAVVSLKTMSGHPTLLTLVYTHCPSACPITVRRLKQIKELAVQQKIPLTIGLVSMDSARDVPARLSKFRKEQQLSEDWKIFTGAEDQVRELAVLLGFSYQKDEATGEFQHSNKIVLLDAQGAIQHSFDGMSTTPEEFIAIIKDLKTK